MNPGSERRASWNRIAQRVVRGQSFEGNVSLEITGVSSAVRISQRFHIAGSCDEIRSVGDDELIVLICAQRADVEMSVILRESRMNCGQRAEGNCQVEKNLFHEKGLGMARRIDEARARFG